MYIWIRLLTKGEDDNCWEKGKEQMLDIHILQAKNLCMTW